VRERLRGLGFGLATVFGFPRGFFIPSRHATQVEPQDYPALEPLFAEAEPRFREVLAGIEDYRGGLEAIAAGAGPARFDQDWFSRLDAAVAYALVRSQKPGRILEIGSGHSTRFLAQAVVDGGLATEITCIDPAPRAKLAGLNVRHEQRLFGAADAALCAELRAGDILFIDSSHVAMPGTDVDRLFLDAIPRLAGGILVHVHDVFLPDRYPEGWAWRGYNEQLLVGALLQGGAFELMFSSRWVATRRPEWLGQGVFAKLSLPAGAFETSLWLRKR
jgi:predicted O-methyltransferase YrrM